MNRLLLVALIPLMKLPDQIKAQVGTNPRRAFFIWLMANYIFPGF